MQPVAALQSEYSLWWRDPERRFCRHWRNSASASCRSARSAKDFLTGKIDETTAFASRRLPQHRAAFHRGNRKANHAFVEWLRNFAARKESRTPAQIALAWLLARKPWNVPFPGPPSGIGLRRTWARRGFGSREDLAGFLDRSAATISVHWSPVSAGSPKAGRSPTASSEVSKERRC